MNKALAWSWGLSSKFGRSSGEPETVALGKCRGRGRSRGSGRSQNRSAEIVTPAASGRSSREPEFVDLGRAHGMNVAGWSCHSGRSSVVILGLPQQPHAPRLNRKGAMPRLQIQELGSTSSKRIRWLTSKTSSKHIKTFRIGHEIGLSWNSLQVVNPHW